jgi:hypothetical protein
MYFLPWLFTIELSVQRFIACGELITMQNYTLNTDYGDDIMNREYNRRLRYNTDIQWLNNKYKINIILMFIQYTYNTILVNVHRNVQ